MITFFMLSAAFSWAQASEIPRVDSLKFNRAIEFSDSIFSDQFTVLVQAGKTKGIEELNKNAARKIGYCRLEVSARKPQKGILGSEIFTISKYRSKVNAQTACVRSQRPSTSSNPVFCDPEDFSSCGSKPLPTPPGPTRFCDPSDYSSCGSDRNGGDPDMRGIPSPSKCLEYGQFIDSTLELVGRTSNGESFIIDCYLPRVRAHEYKNIEIEFLRSTFSSLAVVQ